MNEFSDYFRLLERKLAELEQLSGCMGLVLIIVIVWLSILTISLVR